MEQWNGTSWSIVDFPAHPDGLATFLYDVSCPAATACFAAGSVAVDRAGEGSEAIIARALGRHGIGR